MSKSIKTEHGDTLREQSGTGENYSFSQLIEKNEIPGTPFTLVKPDGKDYFIALGKYRLADGFKSEEEALEHLQYNTYTIVLKMLAIVDEENKKAESQKTNSL